MRHFRPLKQLKSTDEHAPRMHVFEPWLLGGRQRRQGPPRLAEGRGRETWAPPLPSAAFRGRACSR